MWAAGVLLLLLAQPCSGSHATTDDLRRARTWRPRDAFRGQGSLARANAKLNRHLLGHAGLKTKSCEEHTAGEVRETLRALFRARSAELIGMYVKADGRSPVYGSEEEMERQRDAHCHEAVMWYIHHLTDDARQRFRDGHKLPLLPSQTHAVEGEDPTTKLYASKVTCQKCHVGGIDSLGVPEVAPENDKAKARRCYTNYQDLFNVTCGPCDGIAGPYSGDDDKYFTATECVVVAQPEEVKESDRVKPALPHQFTVDVVGGSDRFGRTTNPAGDSALPGPIAKLYGQIYGKWYMDAKPGADLWLLRHDTTYASVTENGIPIPFIKPHVSEIHAQTAKQRATNNTGPMVSLIDGMPSWMPGGCTCMPDPVGVPDISASWAPGLSEMQYMGRIRLPNLEYLNTPIELDHWASWFFHIFMDTNTSMPHYGKAPSRLASAYAGTAVYANWIMEDPKIRDPEVWFRGIPTSPERVGPSHGKYCMDTHKAPICSNISQSTFPPQGEPASTSASVQAGSSTLLPFFPAGHAIADLARAGGSGQIVV